jgi:hypothetical protein
MTVNKGLKSIAESSPNFSNQALENAINEIKNVDKDDGYQFIKSQFDLDKAIHDNTVLTQTQKNDALTTLNNAQPHLQIGRYLNDIVRHTNTILDGSIIPGDSTITGTPEDQGQGSFIELLQSVQTLQDAIPDLFGVPASEKNRDVNDHFGTLNNKFLETEDSSAPVFTRLKRIMELIDTNARATSALNTATAAVRFSNTQLIDFLATLVSDSTDFQTSLDNKVNTTAGNMANLNTRISQIAGDPTTDLVAIREEINTQVALEKSNLSGIRDYIETLTDNSAFAALAEDEDLRKLMERVAQNTNWQTYFRDFEKNRQFLNPKYDTSTDSDKASIIDQLLIEQGLPDVTDFIDIQAVANKAINNSRISSAGFDKLTVEQIIKKCCEQLNIRTDGSVYNQSERLLNNLNAHDRQVIADAIDFNEDSRTLS